MAIIANGLLIKRAYAITRCRRLSYGYERVDLEHLVLGQAHSDVVEDEIGTIHDNKY
jgi:hypothetical protein